MATLCDIIIIFTILFQWGASQREVLIGPRNISRTEGETNVYIPCPFTGSISPIWLIDGVHYEAFNLPENMVSVSFGLLITVVTVEMDRKTFQCMVPKGVNHELYKSSVGMLTVEKSRSLPGSEHVSSFVIGSTGQFSIDHQRTVFGRDFKTISWRDAENCGDQSPRYQMNPSECDGTDIPGENRDRNVIQSTSIPIPSNLTVHNNKLVYFQLTAFDRQTGSFCQRLIPDFSIRENVTTHQRKVPFVGICVNVSSPLGPYIVLPNINSNNDCPCAIIVREDNTYQLDLCSCGRDSIFRESIFVFKWHPESADIYHVCFLNLTRDMNNTRIHFYELYRVCTNNDGKLVVRPYRVYFKSLQIQIVLPDPPHVMVDNVTGQINFSSTHREGIDLDYYQVVIADITRQAVINTTSYGNNISVGDLFQNQICSPYFVRVEAHNSRGATESEETETDSSHNGDVCKCITSKVNADMELVNDDTESEVGGSEISVQVNCSHNYSQPHIYFKVTVLNDGVVLNSSTHLCEDDSNVPFNFLKCDTSYDLMVSWIAMSDEDTLDLECTLNQVQNKKVACSKKHFNHILSPEEIAFIAVSLLLLSIIFVLLVAFSKYVHKSRKFKSTDLVNLGNSEEQS